MVDNRKKLRQNSHLINRFPMSEGVSEVSEQANQWVVRANRRASGPVLQSVFLAVLDQSGVGETSTAGVHKMRPLRHSSYRSCCCLTFIVHLPFEMWTIFLLFLRCFTIRLFKASSLLLPYFLCDFTSLRSRVRSSVCYFRVTKNCDKWRWRRRILFWFYLWIVLNIRPKSNFIVIGA